MDNADPLCFAWASIADSGLKYSSLLLVTPWCTTNEGQALSYQALRTARRLTSNFASQLQPNDIMDRYIIAYSSLTEHLQYMYKIYLQ